jgi:hypothetical protein
MKIMRIIILYLIFQICFVYNARIYPKADDSTLSNFSEIVAEHYVLDFDIDINTKK